MKELIGKSAKVIYNTGFKYRIDYLSDGSLRWTSLKEEDKGASGLEDVFYNELGDGLYTLAWIEDSGVCVSQSLDINKGKIWAFISWDEEGERKGLENEGSFEIIE